MMAEDLSPRFERGQRALAASRDGFWERNLRTGSVWHSPSLLAMLGAEPLAQPGGMDRGTQHVHPDDLAAFQHALAQATPQHEFFKYEARFRTKLGTWHWMRGRGRIWLDPDGAPEYLCGTLTDVHREKSALLALEAQQRQLEALVRERTAGLEAALALAEQRRQEAERANAAKSRFLAHMSHEIRTPLNGVLGLTELALRTELSSQQRRYLESAHSSGGAVLQVISDVLDLSRIESGRVELRGQDFDPVRAMAEALRAVMPLNHNPEVVLAFDWQGDSCWVHGDDSCLRQIVTNLLGNAIKFTPRGHVALQGHIRRLAPEQVLLEISVTDTGPGIPENLHNEVFEPFVQADNSLARDHGGAGLGLAIASRLAQAMTARLQLECPPEGGTVFKLSCTLPWAPTPADAVGPAPSQPGLLWLVYHRPDAGHWLGRRLTRLGWQVRLMNLQQANALAQDSAVPQPDVLLLAEPALAELDDLMPLRQALPLAALRLLVRPSWHNPALEAQANALRIPILVAPLTPDQLLCIAAEQPLQAGADADRRASAPQLLPQAEVLLVEDNPVNQLVGQEFLRALGLSVRLADDGESAIAACLAETPELVLMDLEMPGMDGLQAARRLRQLQRDGLWAGAPIVALTAHAGAADRAACREAGMDGVLTKPLSLDTLRQQLGRWLAL